jgi:hypothetical protein
VSSPSRLRQRRAIWSLNPMPALGR